MPEQDSGGWLTLGGEPLTLDGRQLWLGRRNEDEPEGLFIEVLSARYDSADWTGIEDRVASDPEILSQIQDQASSLDRLIEASGLTNFELARAKALTTSLVALVQSPEPEWRIVVAVLTSPAITAVANAVGIVSFILTLLGLVK